MKTLGLCWGLLLCAVGAVFGQSNETCFFRIANPTDAVIAEFDPVAGIIGWSNGVAGATNQVQRTVDLAATNGGWTDYVLLVSTGAAACTERIIDLDPPEGMVWVPSGSFSMGDNLDGDANAQPVHSVYVSGFYMDRTEVTKAQWDVVYNWAVSHGYGFEHAGSGKASNHPVHTVSWYDCVKWCNARSEKEGKTPCYTVGGNVYRSGQSAPDCNWSASGYRLPTEAEWEKAARGGLSGKRFPWGDTIQHTKANYYSNNAAYSYDTSSTRGHHPDYDNDPKPYTSPVGSFAPNGYGLYDMSGNVWEWCWDWYDSSYYASSPSSNPHGASVGSYRVFRGGGWGDFAYFCRSALRGNLTPVGAYYVRSFRAVLP